jgi:transposase InsO family protein
MKKHYPTVGLEKLCGLFGKTRQAFYDQSWRSSDEQLQEAFVIDKVKTIRSYIEGIGGIQLYNMVKADLKLHDIAIGRDRFYEFLRKHDLLLKRKKRYTITTNSNHPYYKWPDLAEHIVVSGIEQLWVSDITYLRTENGFAYLSLITDAYSRKIIGYHVSQHLKAQGCIIALNKAIGSLQDNKENRKLIHHSDRGIQYCCGPYVTILQNNHIRISMTQSGSPYDNAIAERINGILKHQVGLKQVFKNYASTVTAVCSAIDAYNCLRPHMSVSNLTPQQAHLSTQPLIKKWKNKRKYHQNKERTV